MPRVVRTVAALGVALAVTGMISTSARAATDPVSRIYSPAQNACLDTSTTDPARYFLDTYGAACNGSAPQKFSFRPVATAVPNTFHVISGSSGQCMVAYRQGIRQGACSTDVGWTFRQIGTTGHRYHVLVPSTVASAYPGCIQVNARPSGYPGAIFTEVLCTSSASQVLTLTTAP